MKTIVDLRQLRKNLLIQINDSEVWAVGSVSRFFFFANLSSNDPRAFWNLLNKYTSERKDRTSQVLGPFCKTD